MKTTVSTKGRLILPARMCRLDRIEPGQVFDIERISRGEYRLVRREPSINEGLIDWLVSCPDTEWFVPIESGDHEHAVTSALSWSWLQFW